MAKISLSFFLLFSITSITAATETTRLNGHRFSARPFVETECQGTRYPRLCVQCLSNFVNSTTPTPEQLAQIALKVSLVRARYAKAYVTKVAIQLKQMKSIEYPAVKDCLDQINNGVDQLTHSVKELGRMSIDSESVFSWHQSNVQTWMSTALTDALMCMDSFPGNGMGNKTKAIIRAKVLNVAQVTSNALALFNRFVARHRASRATKP